MSKEADKPEPDGIAEFLSKLDDLDSDDEAFEVAAKRVLKRHIQAFKELAK